MDRKLNYEEVFTNIVNGTVKYIKENNLNSLVLGISGGLDSTVCAAVSKVACDKADIPLICVSLPCNSNESDENESAMHACNEFASQAVFYNLEKEYNVMRDACRTAIDYNSNPISNGNIKARLRMIMLYDIASRTRGIVVGTSNLSEWYTGFWTKNGDVGDLNLIGELWKTEVYSLAKYMLDNVFKDSEALKRAIEITPTDGNVGGSDMDQIMPNHTYNDVDDILYAWTNLSPKMMDVMIKKGIDLKMTVFDEEDEDVKERRKKACEAQKKEFKPTLGDLYGADMVMRVIRRSVNSEFKRKNLEMCIDITNGNVIMH